MQTTPWDVYTAVAYAVVVSGILLATGVGTPLGLFLVILVPGYLVAAILMPRIDDMGWTLRVALTLGLSLALVAFLGLFLNFTPFGITFYSETVSVLSASLLLGLVAYRRRMSVPPTERLEIRLDFARAPWKDYSLLEKALAVGLVIVLAVAIPTLGLALTHPRPTQPFTELYLLGPTGNFSGYPSRLNVSEPGTLQVLVANHEGTAVNYTLRVALLGVQIVVNVTTGANETLVLNRTAGPSWTFIQADGSTWTQPYTFSIPAVGTWLLEFDLYRSSDFSAPYRQVHFLVTVP